MLSHTTDLPATDDDPGPAEPSRPADEAEPPSSAGGPESRGPLASHPPVTVTSAHVGVGDADLAWLVDRTSDVIAQLDATPDQVSVCLVGDDEMVGLHQRHLGLDTTTDVLTFADGDGAVDIAVCWDEAARQSAARGHDVRREALLYIVHGILHATGFDDQDPDEFDRMHAEEDRLLDQIGVGSTFDVPEGGDGASEGGRA